MNKFNYLIFSAPHLMCYKYHSSNSLSLSLASYKMYCHINYQFARVFIRFELTEPIGAISFL